MDAVELQKVLDRMSGTLKNEGFATLEELVSAYQRVLAEKDKAEKARDKFNSANDDAAKIIQSKGSEIGALREQVTELEKERDLLKETVEAYKKNPEARGSGGTTVEKTLEEKCAELEGRLTEDLWDVADRMLAGADDDVALELATPSKARLELLEGLLKDPTLKAVARPKSLRPAQAATDPGSGAGGGSEGLYEKLRRATGLAGPGPGVGFRRTGGGGSGQRQQSQILH